MPRVSVQTNNTDEHTADLGVLTFLMLSLTHSSPHKPKFGVHSHGRHSGRPVVTPWGGARLTPEAAEPDGRRAASL